MIGIVRIILRDGREDVRSGGIQLHQVPWDRRILRVLSVQSFLDLFEGCNAVLQAISFRAQSWLDIRSIVIGELLKVSLGLFLKTRQHDPVRLVARRVVDALKVADDVGVFADHPLLILFRQGIPPGRDFLCRGSGGWQRGTHLLGSRVVNVVVVGSRVQRGYFLRERLDEFLGSSEGCVTRFCAVSTMYLISRIFFPAFLSLFTSAAPIDTFPLASIDMPHVLASCFASSAFARTSSMP